MFACLCVIFIQDKVEINVSDKNGKTPLMLAVGRKHDKVIAYLQKELKQRNSFIPRIDSWWVPGHRLVNVTRSELTWFRQIMTALLRSCSSCSYSLNQLRCAIYAQSDLSCDDSVLWITLVTYFLKWAGHCSAQGHWWRSIWNPLLWFRLTKLADYCHMSSMVPFPCPLQLKWFNGNIENKIFFYHSFFAFLQAGATSFRLICREAMFNLDPEHSYPA